MSHIKLVTYLKASNHYFFRVQGFGYAICKILRSHIDKVLGVEDPPWPLTMSLVRLHCTEKQFSIWYGGKLGSRLWGLLTGEDDEPVHPSPEYPVQISVENSHYGITNIKQAIDEMGVLVLHLLQRLREDLTEAIDGTILTADSGKRVFWAQYPNQLRLTIRQGYEKTRETKSTAFPMDAIDEAIPVEQRANRLTKGVLTSLLKKLLKTTTADGTCSLTM